MKLLRGFTYQLEKLRALDPHNAYANSVLHSLEEISKGHLTNRGQFL